MKRLMAMILCLCMLAGIMAGCTKEPAENKPAENQQNEPANTNVPASSSEPTESNSPAAETEALYGGTLVAIPQVVTPAASIQYGRAMIRQRQPTTTYSTS